MNAFDRAQENYDNQIPEPEIEWGFLDVTKLSKYDKIAEHEMEHEHCGISQVVNVYNKDFAISDVYCQYCGVDVEVDSEIKDSILESMGRE